jgi:hypothetical protein
MKRFIDTVFKQNSKEKSEFLRLPGLVFSYCNDTNRYNVSAVYTSIGLKKSELKDLILIFFLIILISGRVLGQEPVKNSYSATHIYSQPVIDGILNDDA